MRPLGAYTTQDTKNVLKMSEICSKNLQKLMLSKPPKNQNTFENVGPEANCEKTTMKLKRINFEPILERFWPRLEVLGRPLEAILGVLGPT